MLAKISAWRRIDLSFAGKSFRANQLRAGFLFEAIVSLAQVITKIWLCLQTLSKKRSEKIQKLRFHNCLPSLNRGQNSVVTTSKSGKNVIATLF